MARGGDAGPSAALSGRARRWLVALVAVLALAATTPHAARAGNVDVVVDSAKLQLQSAANGEHTVQVTLANISSSLVTLAHVAVPGQGGCEITPVPAAIQSGRRTVVTLTLGSGCAVKDGAALTLTFRPPTIPRSYTLTAAPSARQAHWYILGWGFVGSFCLAVLLALAILLRLWHANRHLDLPGERKIDWRTPLTGLGTSWSFKDNWVGSVTIGSTVLVALLATSNVLSAVLGFAPQAALGVMTVGGALAAVFVGISPLFVKLVGRDLSVPTVLGTLEAAGVTVFGSIGQIVVVTWQGADLASGRARVIVLVLGIGVGALVFWYANKTLWYLIRKGATPPPDKPSDVLRAGEIVAAAIREGSGYAAPPPVAQPEPVIERSALL